MRLSSAAAMASTPYRFTYHLGIYLAVNAIPDAYTLIDGPDCLLRKAEWVHGKHDWNSTLLDALGHHRVVATFIESERVVKNRGEDVEVRIRQIDRVPGARLVLVCSMPHVMIIGTQYDRILRAVQPEVKCRLLELPSRSLDGDWLDGYQASLSAIADDIDLCRAQPRPDRVAIVGYLMDRNEQDHAANRAELERLCGALGLSLCSVWLDGSGYDRLADAGDAGLIVGLPSGLAAARALARRTGARLVEAQTPFGASRTIRFLRTIAEATGRPDCVARVEPFVESQLARYAPRLEWAAAHLFAGKRVAFSGAPDLFGGFLDIAGELGMVVAHLATPSLRHHLRENLEEEFGALPPMEFAPTGGTLMASLDAAGPYDLMIGDSEYSDLASGRAPFVEHGFPSHFEHALSERPFLGFSGWVAFVDRLAQALSRGRRSMQMARDQVRAEMAQGTSSTEPAPAITGAALDA